MVNGNMHGLIPFALVVTGGLTGLTGSDPPSLFNMTDIRQQTAEEGSKIVESLNAHLPSPPNDERENLYRSSPVFGS